MMNPPQQFRAGLLCTCALIGAASLIAINRQAPAKPAPPIVHPIISSDGMLLGASRSGKWILQDKAAPLIKGNEAYQVYGITSPMGMARGGKAISMDAPCPDQMIVTAKLPPNAVIGIGGSWNAIPRRQRMEDTQQPVYQTAVKDVLVANGIKHPDLHIDQIVRCDLDGDGSDEVLISAHRYTDSDRGFQPMPAGGYSLILMRKLVHSKVKTSLVTAEFYPKPKPMSAPLTYKIAGLYDLTGDGKMQIVVRWRYYEGSGTDIYAITGNATKQVLSSGCGA